MSLSKLMKEEGKRSKSASPKVTPVPGTDGGKRKPEDEVDDEDLAKRARLAAGNAAQDAMSNDTADPAVFPPVSTASTEADVVPDTNEIAASIPVLPDTNGVAEETVVKQEVGMDGGVVTDGAGQEHTALEDGGDSVLVKAEPSA